MHWHNQALKLRKVRRASSPRESVPERTRKQERPRSALLCANCTLPSAQRQYVSPQKIAMKITLKISFSFLLLFAACGPSDSFDIIKQAIDNYGYVDLLSVKYFQSLNRWPASLDDLKQFASNNDSLKCYVDSLSTDYETLFSSISADSLQVQMSTKPQRHGPQVLFFVTPKSINTGKKIILSLEKDFSNTGDQRVTIKVVDDTAKIDTH